MAKVLVVDDDASVRDLIALNLQLDGHQVLVAANGHDALDLVGREALDVILLDVMMPGQDGFSVLGELKAAGSRVAGIRVLMVTARAEHLDRIRGGIEGAITYISKPFSVLDLRARVREVLTGDPEAVQRRNAQNQALIDLARIEAGPHGLAEDDGIVDLSAHPRLTRLESPRRAGSDRFDPTHGPSSHASSLDRRLLTARENEVLDAIVTSSNLPDAAEALGVSRTYVYSSLRRIAHKCGEPSGPELVRRLRSGELVLSAR